MLRLALGLLVLWLLWVSVGALFQRRFLYPGAYADPPSSGTPPDGVEAVWLTHAGGRSEAWHLPPARQATGVPAPALIHFHGNGEFIDDRLEALRPFAEELGMHLLLVEYPGFGRSPGVPTREAIVAAAGAAWRTLAARDDVDAERIAVMGRSLGGGPAAELARERGAAALVLQSTFTDVGTMAARHSGIPPALIRDRWQPARALAAYGGPTLVLHGRRDRIVPFRHGEALAAVHPGVRFLPLDCGHNDCPPPGPAWWGAVRSFLVDAGVLARGAGG
jgi:hypothetical protein